MDYKRLSGDEFEKLFERSFLECLSKSKSNILKTKNLGQNGFQGVSSNGCILLKSQTKDCQKVHTTCSLLEDTSKRSDLVLSERNKLVPKFVRISEDQVSDSVKLFDTSHEPAGTCMEDVQSERSHLKKHGQFQDNSCIECEEIIVTDRTTGTCPVLKRSCCDTFNEDQRCKKRVCLDEQVNTECEPKRQRRSDHEKGTDEKKERYCKTGAVNPDDNRSRRSKVSRKCSDFSVQKTNSKVFIGSCDVKESITFHKQHLSSTHAQHREKHCTAALSHTENSKIRSSEICVQSYKKQTRRCENKKEFGCSSSECSLVYSSCDLVMSDRICVRTDSVDTPNDSSGSADLLHSDKISSERGMQSENGITLTCTTPTESKVLVECKEIQPYRMDKESASSATDDKPVNQGKTDLVPSCRRNTKLETIQTIGMNCSENLLPSERHRHKKEVNQSNRFVSNGEECIKICDKPDLVPSLRRKSSGCSDAKERLTSAGSRKSWPVLQDRNIRCSAGEKNLLSLEKCSVKQQKEIRNEESREVTLSDLEAMIPLTIDNCNPKMRQSKYWSKKSYIRPHSEGAIWSSILSHYE